MTATLVSAHHQQCLHRPQVVLAGGSCKIPRLQQMLREEFSSSEVLTSIAPDEVVVVGCAMEAGILGAHQGKEEGADSGMVPCTPEDIWIAVSVFCVHTVFSVVTQYTSLLTPPFLLHLLPHPSFLPSLPHPSLTPRPV